MIEGEGGEAATVETTTQAATEAAVSSQEQEKATERDYVAEATKMGWRPKEEWKGKPENWKDAETYVAHGEDIVRITKSELTKLQSGFDERLAGIEKVNANNLKILKAQHAKEIADLTAERKTAIKAANVDEVERIDSAIKTLEQNAPDAAPAEDGPAVQAAWIKNQDWWEKDEDMTAYAIFVSQGILAKNPDVTMTENLRQTDEKLRAKFPEKFGGKKPAANGHAAVDGGGDFPGARPKDAFSKLPPEAQAQAKKDVAAKLYKDVNEWASVYNAA